MWKACYLYRVKNSLSVTDLCFYDTETKTIKLRLENTSVDPVVELSDESFRIIDIVSDEAYLEV